MKNVDPFFSITNFQTWFLARRADEALPDTVIKNLSEGEKNDKAKRLLEIIQEFEKSPTDIEAKEKKYTELMKLFYKGIGLKEDGTGTISEENQRGAIELSGLINDALLQDQQNISGKYSPDQLQKALKLQDRFRKDLENTDFKKILTADKVKDTEIIAGRNDYQTEKITSYLAENKEDFTEIFQELSKARPDLKNLTTEQKEKLKNLETLAGEKGQNSLNVILRTFKDFKEYSFTNADLTKMKKTAGAELLAQAKTESTHSQWKKLETTLASNESDEDDDKETRTSRRESRITDRALKRILARLEKLEERDTEQDPEYERPSTPGWLGAIHAGLGIAGKFLNITGLGNNNQDYCCYSPAPCYGGGGYRGPICRQPYYVGGDTWPWGRANGVNSEYSAFNNYMPSSGSYASAYNPSSSTSSSDPYSSSSAYNPISIEVNPIFNNNPTQTSSSTSYSGSRSSNMAAIRSSFGIS